MGADVEVVLFARWVELVYCVRLNDYLSWRTHLGIYRRGVNQTQLNAATPAPPPFNRFLITVAVKPPRPVEAAIATCGELQQFWDEAQGVLDAFP